ncbi:MAG: EAL domain-containing protein [Deltaproteobacteria bacterium]|nr:EAL domain-containing protein [Deltaproteobacteria bacterium]
MNFSDLLPELLAQISLPLALLDGSGRLMNTNPAWRQAMDDFGLIRFQDGGNLSELISACSFPPGEAEALVARLAAFVSGTDKEFSCTVPLSQDGIPARLRLAAMSQPSQRLLCVELHHPCSDKALRESEVRLRTLLDAMPDFVCFKDGQGRWLEANQADLALFQLSGVDYQGKTDAELAAASPFYRPVFLACAASDEAAWVSGTLARSEQLVSHQDGGFTALDLYKIPLFHADGSRKGLVLLGRDITSYKQTQKHLEQVLLQQEIIEQLFRLSFTDVPLENQLGSALDIIVTTPWLSLIPKGGIFLVDRLHPETIFLRVNKDMDPSQQGQCASVRFGECLCGKAAQERKFIFTQNHPGCRDGKRVDHGHYIIPILHGQDELLGILMLYATTDHLSTPAEQRFLETVASGLALLIARQQTADRIRLSEANLAKAQQIAQLGYWDWHILGNTLFWSDEVYRIFGLVPTAISPTYDEFLSYLHPDDRPRIEEAVGQSLASKAPYSIEHRVIRQDGTLRVVHEQGEVEFDASGQAVRMFGTTQDITLLKHSEQQLTLAARVFDNSIEGITVTDAFGVIQSVNRGFTHITGYAPEEAVGNKPSILKSDRHDAAFYQAMWQTLLATGRWEGEIWNRRKNGEVYPEWLNITAITDDFGQTSHHVAVFHDMSEIRGIEEKLHFQANHDALTSLPNRTLMLDRLAVAIGHAQSQKRLVAVLTLDLDNFKHVNDSLGHTVGDVLLQQVAERLKKCVAPDITVARLGGDDFAILIEQLASEQEAVRVAQTIIAAFAAPFNLAVYETVVTISVGISFFPADGADADTLLKNAELAMYRAKEEGKNTYQMFTKAMNAQVVHRLSLENSLRKALDRKEFLVYYQPKVSLVTGRIVGMEALVRWRAADGRLISPLDFIPLAEETGLIIPIGELVLRQACLDTKGWLRDYNDRLALSVNLSPRQFMQQDLLATVTAIIAETGFPSDRLELEITESAVMAHEEAAIILLRKIKEMGVRLALDDFGTGYSSLQYLRKLPFDTLKMDRSFVIDLPEDQSSAAIAITILTLAKSLWMEVVAEGVETVEQLEFLRSHKCGEIQGFLFSPPVPAEAFAAMLRDGRTLPLSVAISPGDCP